MGEAGSADLLNLTIPGELRELAAVRRAVRACACAFGFSEEQAAHICLAVDEALVNVIMHGYGGPTAEKIELSIRPVGSQGQCGLRIRIRDYGRRVEPSTIKGRNLDDVRPGGVGVHIIRSIMDEVCFTQAEDRGMILQMVKRLPQEVAPDPEKP